jgi:hypothetical protein
MRRPEDKSIRGRAANLVYAAVKAIDNSGYQGEWPTALADTLWRVFERVQPKGDWRRLRYPFVVMPGRIYGLIELTTEEEFEAAQKYLREQEAERLRCLQEEKEKPVESSGEVHPLLRRY